jgi:addiction module HigA family antidote
MALSQEHIDDLLSRSRRPNDPGSVLLDIIEDDDNDYTIESFAKEMNVSIDYLTSIIKGAIQVNDDIANRIGNVLGNGPELWLNLQEAVNIWDNKCN